MKKSLLILILVIIPLFQIVEAEPINPTQNITEVQDINEQQILYSPDKSDIGQSAVLSLVIGLIGALLVIIYLLSIIYNYKFRE
jgi:hypothetical protein